MSHVPTGRQQKLTGSAKAKVVDSKRNDPDDTRKTFVDSKSAADVAR